MHRVDAPAVFIFGHDDAWNRERIAAELGELVEMKRKAVQAAAVETMARGAGLEPDELTAEQRETAEGSVVLTVDEETDARERHPVARYLAGETRFDVAAPDVGPRGPVASVRDYLLPDGKPSEFVLRRMNYAQRIAIEIERDLIRRCALLVRAGVKEIREGGVVRWAAKSDEDVLPDEWLDVLTEAAGSASNLITLAGACKRYSAPLTEAEGKR